MAPQPKRKHANQRGRVRTMALRLSSRRLSPCPSCTKLREPHRVCPHCGYYDGRAFIVKKDVSQGESRDESKK